MIFAHLWLKEPRVEENSSKEQRPIWLRDTLKKTWKPAETIQRKGSVAFVVRTEEGKERLAHRDHVRSRECSTQSRVESHYSQDEPVWGLWTTNENEARKDSAEDGGNQENLPSSAGDLGGESSTTQTVTEQSLMQQPGEEEDEEFHEAVEQIIPSSPERLEPAPVSESLAQSRGRRIIKKPDRYAWST